MRVKVAHVRLCHSWMFLVVAYPRETQEMVFARPAHVEHFPCSAAPSRRSHPHRPGESLIDPERVIGRRGCSISAEVNGNVIVDFSASSQLDFDPPVAAVADFVFAPIERLVLAEAGGDQAVAAMPRWIRKRTTEIARPVESSQLEGNCGVEIG